MADLLDHDGHLHLQGQQGPAHINLGYTPVAPARTTISQTPKYEPIPNPQVEPASQERDQKEGGWHSFTPAYQAPSANPSPSAGPSSGTLCRCPP